MNLFGTKKDIETVRKRLEEAEEQVGKLEAKLSEVSLGDALAGSYSRSAELTADLRDAQERVAVLRRALAVAEEAERARLAEARGREHKARVRALKAHLANLQRHAGEYEVAAAALAVAWSRMKDAAGAAVALVPPARAVHDYEQLHDGRLRRLGERELARVGYVAGHLGDQPDMPGANAAPLGGELPGHLKPISEAVREISVSYADKFAAALAADPAPVVASPPAEQAKAPKRRPVEPRPEAGNTHSVAVASPATTSGGNPWPEGTPQHDEFEAELASLARQPAMMEVQDG